MLFIFCFFEGWEGARNNNYFFVWGGVGDKMIIIIFSVWGVGELWSGLINIKFAAPGVGRGANNNISWRGGGRFRKNQVFTVV